MKTDEEFCKVLETYGTLGQKRNRTGELCEVKVCAVSWRGKYRTYDIRAWKPDGSSDKGISLNAEQMKKLRDVLNSMNFEA